MAIKKGRITLKNQKLVSNDNIWFRTIHALKENGYDGHIVAILEPLNKEKTKFRAQFAFCSPRDQFNSTKGRAIAYLRLISRKRDVLLERAPNIKIKQLLKSAILLEASRKNIFWLKDKDTSSLV